MSLNVLDVNRLTWRHSNFANGVWVKDLGISDSKLLYKNLISARNLSNIQSFP